MIYDCFLFHNELELLELRLTTLAGVVDRFVLVEADRTFRGQPKEMAFAANRERFRPYLDRIEYVPVRDAPSHDNAWVNQRFQRDAVVRGLGGCGPDDLVILSDVDEIPHPDALRRLQTDEACRRILRRDPIVLAQQMYYYYANCLDSEVWKGSIAIRRENLTMTPQELRALRFHLIRLKHGGWHFTYMGGAERVLQKLRTLSGEEEARLGAALDLKTLEESLRDGKNILTHRGGRQFTFIELDDQYPAGFREWTAAHPGWICSPATGTVPRPPAPDRRKAELSHIVSWEFFKVKRQVCGWLNVKVE